MPSTKSVTERVQTCQSGVVRLSHLGLPVRDAERSQRFYAAYFGFDLGSARTYDDGTVIIRDSDDLRRCPASSSGGRTDA